jgi:hypothetical protein
VMVCACALWWWWSVSSARVSWPQSSLPVSARRALSPPFSQPAVLPIVLSACRSLHRCWPNLYRPFAQHGAVSVPQHITFALLPFPVLPRVNISRRRRPLLSLWPLRRRYCCCQYRVLALRRCRLRLAPRGCPRLRCGASLTPPGPHPPLVLPGPRRRSALAARAIAARSAPSSPAVAAARPAVPRVLLPPLARSSPRRRPVRGGVEISHVGRSTTLSKVSLRLSRSRSRS